mgnify:CR=1 FL=1
MNIAIILAGGTGTRLGGEIPKQYIQVKGKPIIEHCLEKFVGNPLIDAIQIVADSSWHEYIKKCLDQIGGKDVYNGFSLPGENRQLSIYHALQDVLNYASDEDYVMIHDAARPLIRRDFIEKCFEAVQGHEGVLPVLPMKDTVYMSEDGHHITSLLNRDKIFAGQAPEVFKLGAYYSANKQLLPDRIYSINGSTEPAIIAGMDIVVVDGEEENFKITTREDLKRFTQYIDN